MTDDDLSRLASSYLDDEASADERAIADGDAVVLAEMERLRTVRLLLADLDSPSISMREAHLAGALDAWDRLPEAERTGARREIAGIDSAAVAGASTVSTPRRLRRRRRTSSTARLTAAAAALVLVLVGGVALQLRSSDDDSFSSADGASDTTATVADASTARTAEAPAEAIVPPAPAGGTADAVTSELATGSEQAAPPPDDAGLVQLLTPADLADFAGAAHGVPGVSDEPTATSTTGEGSDSSADDDRALPICLGVDIIVGPAAYGDVAVVVGIDENRDLAIAYQPASCTEVARVRLP